MSNKRQNRHKIQTILKMSQNKISKNLSKSDFQKICRLCLKEKEKMVSVYNSVVMNMLKKITDIKIYLKDGLPNQICFECKYSARQSFKFKQRCEKFDKILWDVFSNEVIQTKIKDDLEDENCSEQKNTKIDQDCTDADNDNKNVNESIKQEITVKPDLDSENESLSCLQSLINIKEEIDRNSDCSNSVTKKEIVASNDFDNEYSDGDSVNGEDDVSEKSEDYCKNEMSNDTEYREDDSVQQNKIIIFKVNPDKDSGEIIKRYPPKPPVSLDPEKCDLEALMCKICGKTLVTKHTLARHMETHNENRKITHTCPTCNKPFYNVGQYNKHMRWHEGKTRYNCEICNKPFFELSAQAVHMKKHKVKPMSCDICQKQFLVKLQLEIHKQKMHEKKEYFCSICNKSFPQQCLVKKHERIHTTEKPFLCIKCSASFKQEWSLRIHMSNVHSENSHKEVCNICGKSVKKLRYHMVTHQNREKRHKCGKCDQSFYTGYSLNAHMRVKHATEKPCLALCPVCGKQCETIGYLNAHMHIHKAERPHSCNDCGKSFKLKVQLKSHQITHTDSRPFVCSMCGRGFTAKSVLKKHILTHTGERPHVCHICQRAFAQRSALKTHMKIH